MNSFDTKFYSLDTNVIKVDSGTNKLLGFNAETYSRKFRLPLRSPFTIFVNTKIGCGSA